MDATPSSAPMTMELGQTGLRGATPSEGWLHQEFLAKLRGTAGLKIYREMAENDPLVGAVLQSFEMLIRSLQWTWTAADQSQEALTVKEFYENVFFKYMESTFGDTIEESLAMLPYGFMPMEIVLRRAKEGEDGNVVIHKLAPRGPYTVWRWHFDKTGGLLGMTQQLQYGGTVDIPVSKLVIFRTTSRLGNPEGRSILRNAYTSYVKKNLIEDAEGKAALRAAGLVVMRIPQKFLDPKASEEDKRIRQQYELLMRNIARDRQGALLLSSRKGEQGSYDYDIEYKVADGQRTIDHSSIINRHDQRIAMSMMADFIMLGHGKVGSYALSQDKTDLFSTAVGALADRIAEPFNRQLAPLIAKYNDIPPELIPVLTHSEIKAPDAEIMANIATMLGSSGFEGVITPDVASTILRAAKLPVSQTTSDEG